MERLGLTWRLLEAYGLTTLPGSLVKAPAPAEEAALLAFHTEEYLSVLKAANTGQASAAVICRYGLGPGDNPVFPGLWDVARLAAGGSLLAARLVASGEGGRAFHFAGGLPHAMPDRASGFCYVNHAGLAILHLRAQGLRVAYGDIDAHHGDGVQVALDVQGFARAVERIVGLAPRLVALGGGGYDIGNVARAWTAAWAAMNEVELPPELPAAYLEHARWFRVKAASLWDPPAVLEEPRRRLVQEYADRQVDAIQRMIFPRHGL